MYSFMTTYADNVALPALAAVRRAAATTAVQQSIDISYPPSPQQQTHRTLLQRTNGTDRQTDGRTDGHRAVTDRAPHTMRLVPIMRPRSDLVVI